MALLPAWPVFISATVALLGLILAVLRVGASAVRTNTTIASSVAELTRSVERIEKRVEGYISGEDHRDEAMEVWRRSVDARLLAIEATIQTLIMRAPRRRTD